MLEEAKDGRVFDVYKSLKEPAKRKLRLAYCHEIIAWADGIR